MLKLFENFGKREILVYIVVFLWVAIGLFAAYRETNFAELASYFGALTAYVAAYVWGETKRPSDKTSIMLKGPSSRREVMIYLIVVLWTIVGVAAIWFKVNLNELAVYFLSLTGFVASWIAGEVFKPEDKIKVEKKTKEIEV